MEIPLPYTPDKIKVFLEFLERTFGELGGGSSSGSWISARTYVESVRVTVPIPDGPGVLTTWTFTWGADETRGISGPSIGGEAWQFLNPCGSTRFSLKAHPHLDHHDLRKQGDHWVGLHCDAT